jgi:hypothetical protein
MTKAKSFRSDSGSLLDVAIRRSRRTEAFAFARAVKIGSQELSVNILQLQAA